MKTLHYHLHRDLLLEFLTELKKMLCLLILCGLCGYLQQNKHYRCVLCAPHRPTTKTTEWPSPPCKWRERAKVNSESQ